MQGWNKLKQDGLILNHFQLMSYKRTVSEKILATTSQIHARILQFNTL